MTPASPERAAARLRSTAGRLEAARRGLPGSDPGWTGAAAREAATTIGAVDGRLADLREDVVTAAAAVARLAGALDAADAVLAAARARAAAALAIPAGTPIATHLRMERSDGLRLRAEDLGTRVGRDLVHLDAHTARLLDGLVSTGGTIGPLPPRAEVATRPGPLDPDVPAIQDALVRSTVGPEVVPAGLLAPGRTFLMVDPDGDGRVVEVFGDLPSARHVAVLVPGTGATIRNHDAPVHGLSRRAATLYRAAGGEAEGVAVIAWLGYDAPELGPSMLSTRRARAGASDLRRLVTSLAADRPHVTVVGHSYGAVVAAMAAAAGMPAADLVLVGSPGVPLDDAGDLRPGGAGRVWVLSSDHDPITRISPSGLFGRLAGRTPATDGDGDPIRLSHGPNPAAESFGAVELETDGVAGHSDYFLPGTGSLGAIAAVVRGEAPMQDAGTAAG